MIAAHLAAMSKAFTKEAETEADLEDEISALPLGVKNYITAEGLQRLQEEFARLRQVERPLTVETVS
jgi:transcription elongation factor GreB